MRSDSESGDDEFILSKKESSTFAEQPPPVLSDMHAVDLVLSEWLSVTSLPTPKLMVVSRCRRVCLAALSKPFRVYINAFGSGEEIVPCFHFDHSSTVKDLFTYVRQSWTVRANSDHTKEEIYFRLFFDEKELREHDFEDRRQTLRSQGVTDNAVISLVVVHATALLETRAYYVWSLFSLE